MIEIKNISKSFSKVKVLENISIKFEKNNIYTVIGGSGHGKTVFLKCIIGLLEPEEGEILYDGVSFLKLNRYNKRITQKNMGVVFQGNALFDSLTVEENIQFPLKMFTQMDSSEKHQRVEEVLEDVGLKNINHKYPSEISGGMQKRVAIARAIANRPQYLFFDEPNSGLDPYSSHLINELIYHYNKKYHITCILNTHDMNSVKRISDKIVFIKHGKMTWFGNINDIKRNDPATKEIEEFIYSKKLKIN